MKKFTYDFSVPANSQEEAEAKMSALRILASKLSATELMKIAEVVNNPIKLLIAKEKLGL